MKKIVILALIAVGLYFGWKHGILPRLPVHSCPACHGGKGEVKVSGMPLARDRIPCDWCDSKRQVSKIRADEIRTEIQEE